MAAAVVGNTLAKASMNRSQTTSTVESTQSDSDEMDNYIDNIRDQPQLTTTTLLGRENVREVVENTNPVHVEGDAQALSKSHSIKEAEAKFPLSTDLKNIFRLIEEFEAEKMEIEAVLKPFLMDVRNLTEEIIIGEFRQCSNLTTK
jgi:hypothetical protein